MSKAWRKEAGGRGVLSLIQRVGGITIKNRCVFAKKHLLQPRNLKGNRRSNLLNPITVLLFYSGG